MSLETIKLALFDVDGTMTDGGMWVSEREGEMKCFDVKDGLGIVLLRSTDIITGIVSARVSRVTAKRARELRIPIVVQGLVNKADALPVVTRRARLQPEQILFMGDDVNDLPLMELVGASACPADAAPEVRAFAGIVAAHPGGHGAVREVCELLLRSRTMTPRSALDSLLHTT